MEIDRLLIILGNGDRFTFLIKQKKKASKNLKAYSIKTIYQLKITSRWGQSQNQS